MRGNVVSKNMMLMSAVCSQSVIYKYYSNRIEPPDKIIGTVVFLTHSSANTPFHVLRPSGHHFTAVIDNEDRGRGEPETQHVHER